MSSVGSRKAGFIHCVNFLTLFGCPACGIRVVVIKPQKLEKVSYGRSLNFKSPSNKNRSLIFVKDLFTFKGKRNNDENNS